MLAVQLCITFTFCVVSRDFLGNPFSIPAFDKALLQASLPMTTLYVLNVAAGMMGLQLVNVPMFFCIRRTVAAFILLYEFLSAGKVAEPRVRAAVGVIVAGTLLAGYDSLSNDLLGYIVTMVNNLLSAAAMVSQRSYSDRTGLGTWGVVYFQAMTALPMALALAAVTGEFGRYASFSHATDPAFLFGVFAASCMGLLLTVSSMLSNLYNSPLATSITGNVKDVATTAIGWMVFSGFVATFKSVGGILLSFAGSAWYSYINLQKAWERDRAKAGASAASGNQILPGAAASPIVGSSVSSGSAAAMPAEQTPDEEKMLLSADGGGGSGGGSSTNGLAARAVQRKDAV